MKHNNADALSRRPCLFNHCKHCDRLDSREEMATSQNGLQLQESIPVRATDEVPAVSVLDVGQYTELRDAQLKDPDIRPILEWKEKSANRPGWQQVAPFSPVTKLYWLQWKSLDLRDGVLYRLWETPAGDRVISQLVLPKVLRKEAFHLLHSTPTAGHMGTNKTISRLQQRFYWPHLHRDVKDWCAQCDMCASRRGPPRRHRAPMSQYNVCLLYTSPSPRD